MKIICILLKYSLLAAI